MLYSVCLLSFGVWSVCEFLACEGMNDTTNLAVVDLSPYGFVFKELALQTLILHDFLSFLFFWYFVTNHFAHCRNHFAQLVFKGCTPPLKDRGRFHAWIHPCMHLLIQAWMHTWMQGCIHECMHGCMHAWIHAWKHAWMHAWIHAWMHAWRHA